MFGVFELAAAMVASQVSLTVAAVHYTGTPHAVNPNCGRSHTCAVTALVSRAAKRGAKLIVTPEYAFEQEVPDPLPELGRVETSTTLIGRFAKLADRLDVHLVINLLTRRGKRDFNTQVMFDPRGHVIGTHNKFELFGAEQDELRAGQDVTVVDTPFGRVGLLICADLYGDPHRHERLTETLGADIVAVSSMWTVAGAPKWPAAFAADWSVHVVAANSSAGDGRGSGIFGPTGQTLAISKVARPGVVLKTIQLQVRSVGPSFQHRQDTR